MTDNYFLPADIARLFVAYIPWHQYPNCHLIPHINKYLVHVDRSPYSLFLDAIIRNDVDYCTKTVGIFVNRFNRSTFESTLFSDKDVDIVLSQWTHGIPAYITLAITYSRIDILTLIRKFDSEAAADQHMSWKIHFNAIPPEILLVMAPDIKTLNWVWDTTSDDCINNNIYQIVEYLVKNMNIRELQWLATKPMRAHTSQTSWATKDNYLHALLEHSAGMLTLLCGLKDKSIIHEIFAKASGIVNQ
jgi:hypothetical protein